MVKGEPLIATGLASITLPDSDLRSFIQKIKYQKAYNVYLADGAWTQETEPLKGLYTYDYTDRALRYAMDAGLMTAIQIGGIHNDPEWARFEYEPARANDGQFLFHFNNISIWARSPAEYIRKHMENTMKRYSGIPNLAYWKCWCYEGEGFTHDWFYMWMHGDVRSGYCEPGIRHYREYLKKKYKEIAVLNQKHKTDYRSFAEIVPPQPVLNLRLRDRLRNPRPMFRLAYEDFIEMKQHDFMEYWESFVFTKLRALDPGRMFAVYYYPDSEGEEERASKGVFSRNPGLLKHNAGFNGINIFGTQSLFYAIYEGLSGMMSEDGAVWNDTIDHWMSEFHGTLRLGGEFTNFFNYTIYQTRAHDIELEKYDLEKAEFFREQRKEFLPKIRKMKRISSRFAVYHKYSHSHPIGKEKVER